MRRSSVEAWCLSQWRYDEGVRGQQTGGYCFPHLLIEHMNMHAMAECTEMIDSYARMRNGRTWKTTREACGLKKEVQTTSTEEETLPPAEEEQRRLCELSDALVVVAIEHDTEVQETHASITALWNLLAFPNVANAPQGKNTAREHLARMLQSDL